MLKDIKERCNKNDEIKTKEINKTYVNTFYYNFKEHWKMKLKILFKPLKEEKTSIPNNDKISNKNITNI